MFTALGKLAYRSRWPVLIGGLVFVLVSAFFGYNVSQFLKVGGFIDPQGESAQAAATAARFLGRDQGTLVVLFNSKNGATFDQPQFRQEVEETLAKLNGQPGVGGIFTFYNTGMPQFVSDDKTSTYAVVGLPGDEDAQVRNVTRLRPLVPDTANLRVRLGGRPAVNEEIVEQSEKDLMRAELFTFPIVGILLLIIFRSAIAAMLPLIIGGTAIIGAYLILRISSNFADISVFSLNIITMLGLGLSIDYSLFVVSRFREELALHGGEVRPALIRTMQTAGHTVFFSGLTVIISLLSLLVFNPPFLKSMGFGGAVAVLIAMLSAITILPAILAILGHNVNRFSVNSLFRRGRAAPVRSAEQGNKDFWYRSSQFVMRRPVLVLVLTLIPLLLIGSPFLRINFSTFDARTLPDTHASRQVSEYLTQHFPRNETSPVEIVVRANGPVLAPDTLGALFDYTRQVQALPGVRRVDSLVTIDPNLDKAAYARFYSAEGQTANPQAAQLAQRFARDNHTIINVIYQDDQYASSTQDLVRNIRKIGLPAGLQIQIGGDTALLVDLLSSLGSSLPLAFGLVVGILFVLLYLMLGSLVVPLKAVILNILSLSACFGTLVLVFQDGNFANLLGFTPTGAIDSTQPVLIFAGAFGLSLDYEVFLLSRIKEHYDRTKDLRASVALGVQKTGGIITSAALLLVVVIGSFVTGEVLFIKQIGLGLAVAILVDATIVRTLLLPASMRLMGKYNWWAPAPLVWLHHRLGLAEVESEPEVRPAPQPGPAAGAATSLAPNLFAPGLTWPPSAAGNLTNLQPVSPFPENSLNRLGPAASGGRSTDDMNDSEKESLHDYLKKQVFGAAGQNMQNDVIVRHLLQLAEVCQSLGREVEAAEYYERSLKMMRETGADNLNQVIILMRLSGLYTELEDTGNGLRVAHDGLRLSRLTEQAAAEFNFLYNLTELGLVQQDLKQARQHAWQAFQLAQRRADPVRLRRAERLLARVEAHEELMTSRGSQTSTPRPGAPVQTSVQAPAPNSDQTPVQTPASGPHHVTSPNFHQQAAELYSRGNRLLSDRDYYQAIEAYSQALEYDPRLVKAYVNRAIAYKAIQEFDRALQDYSRALELEPDDADIWFNRGNTYFSRHDYNRALQDYAAAIRLNPSDPDLFFNRGEAYRNLGQSEPARHDFRRVLELSQGQDHPRVRRARNILARLGEPVNK